MLPTSGKPYPSGRPLDDADHVYRVARHTRLDAPGPGVEVSPKDFDPAPLNVSAQEFALSTSDKASERKLLSLFEESLASAQQAAELLGKPGRQLVLRLQVGAMRAAGPPASVLDIVWDRRADCYRDDGSLNGRLGTGSAAHCGAHGLAKEHYAHRNTPPSEKAIRKSLRQRLADLASRREAQRFVQVTRGTGLEG